MPPRRWSRHTFTEAVQDEDGRLYLTEREPYRYRALADNRPHEVSEGETLWTIAGDMFPNFENANDLFWVIADFQPDPIIDVTIALRPGQVLIVPSERVLLEEIFSEARRADIGG